MQCNNHIKILIPSFTKQKNYKPYNNTGNCKRQEQEITVETRALSSLACDSLTPSTPPVKPALFQSSPVLIPTQNVRVLLSFLSPPPPSSVAIITTEINRMLTE